MEPLEISERIKKALCKHPQLYFVSPPDPHIEIYSSYADWPDTKTGADSAGITCDLNPEETRMHNMASEIYFYYRHENPAILLDFFCLAASLRKQGLGNVLFNALEDMASNLGCEDRLFITEVTNPSWWTHKGFIKFPAYSVDFPYWMKKSFVAA